jgi:lipopolysaccharide/colanic/teichoic acid biosynthesis glycosyltransferase
MRIDPEVKTGPLAIYGVTTSISAMLYRGQLDWLRRNGFRVALVASQGSDLDAFATSESAISLPLAMEREIRPWRDLVSLGRMVRLLYRLRPAITNFGTPKAGLLGNVAAWTVRVPARVYTLHGLRLETAHGLKRKLLWLCERVASACAERIVCVSPSLRNRGIALGLFPAEKAVVLENGSCNGVDTERFSPPRRGSAEACALAQKLGIQKTHLVMGFVGRFTRDKGIEELIEAFRELSTSRPELRLLLVGDFENGDPVPSDVRQYIETTQTILRPGFVADTSPYYALMDVLALPTYREGFPGVPLEAQASEVPVVITNATGSIDSVQDGLTGLIVPVGDPRALAEAIETLLRDPALRTTMGRAGRKWMERDFRPQAIWLAHADLYREMLKENAQRQARGREARKRAFDLFASVAALVTLSPLIAGIALLVRIFLGSPVLFRQDRPGYKNRPFTCLKFRTMVKKRDANGNLLPDNERLTRLGRLLRSASLDELPQLINVLRGEMSFVGPRPLLMQYLERYTPEQRRRHEARPGITGWAQVNGRNVLSWQQKFELDLWYVDHQSFWLDIRILAITLLQVVQRNGISQSGHATMPEFFGGTPKP